MIKQMIVLKKKFPNYKSFATATMDDVLLLNKERAH